MKHLQKICLIIVLIFIACLSTSCGKKYTVKFLSDNELVKEVEIKKGEKVSKEVVSKNGYSFTGWYEEDKLYNFDTEISSNITLVAGWEIINFNINYNLNEGVNSLNNPLTYTIENEVIFEEPSKSGYNFAGWFTDSDCTISINTIAKGATGDVNVYAKWELASIRFNIVGSKNFDDEGTTKLTAKVDAGVPQPTFEWKIENENIVQIDGKGKNYVALYGVNPGKTKVYITATYPDGTVENEIVEVEVLGNDFEISYELNQNDQLIFPTDAITSYNTGKLPVELPKLERDYYVFAGWTIKGYDGVYTKLSLEDNIDGNLILSPKWLYPHMELSFDNNLATVEMDETIKLVVNAIDFEENIVSEGFIFKSLNEKIVTIDENGSVYGVSKGYTEILVSLKNNEAINTTIGITVVDDYNSMDEVLAYFVSIANSNNEVKKIKVTGWQRIYSHELRTSVIGYLFEDLVITENIAPLGNGVRPGTIYKKEYICVHDTGDVDYTAKDWSNTVYNNYNALTGKSYGASYQYVIDNKDCFHNIPDNERSYHAGDGNRTYEEVASGVYGTEKYPTITITTDGYYAINGEKTTVLAPTGINGEILKTSDINDYGIRCVIRNGQYYLGKTWYDTTYRKIGNYGGNNNSIGIESCVTEGDDIYYTWQRLAKLVAKLMDENNLTIDDVVTHHYFSGKNCPQTMREAGFYMHFKKLVEIEYNVLQFIKQGYTVSFESNNTEYVNNSGRVIKTSPLAKTVSYTINVEKDGVKNSITLSSVIQFTPYL